MAGYLHACGLSKHFGGTAVLDGIDFTLSRGECLVLLGPSGCGKTTLLNIIAGLLQADGGELHCDGAPLDVPASGHFTAMRERGFSMVFQDFSLWPHMTVAQNVAFGLGLRGLSRADVTQQTHAALARVQMTHLADRKPAALSGGQQQRVAIARAIAVSPRVLLLDEPLSALDARLREDLKSELAQLLRDTGLTAVYVTHDQSEALSLANRIALMNQGRIEQIDAPENIYQRPRTRFAAEFIGSANLVPYQRTRNGLQLDGQTALTGASTSQLATLPATGHLVIRREAVRMVAPDSAPCGSQLVLQGTCVRRHYLGDRQEVLAEIRPGLQLCGFADQPFHPGAAVSVRISAEALHAIGH
ncbi:ABC transporter ATP-binding protein [Alcanivorax quisquiliarum]|uniref:ABC transporter ATP-binding protein n=1 Tax=Alcanivorax quisquiliarum TaxID=2933565 RepID=A0ABT0E9W8_9GAMM|nr:ABC transporter ATP-binding protein [Alcanivorax quisquiliarum]MCK0538616.1 ABC transporter ATP-binding protein [Alcanivorax quisquiliarum]